MEMQPIECDIRVTWRHRVFFTEHVFDATNDLLSRILLELDSQTARTTPCPAPRKVLLFVDESLAAGQPDLASSISAFFSNRNELHLVTAPIVLAAGEGVKHSTSAVERVHLEIERHHIDRQSYVIALGGGALLDAVGFAAATAHRGVRMVRVPSTVLSQCDSGVGVKNGINAFGKKNFIGTFSPPFAVVIDFALLSSLPDRHKRAGYAEAVKVACIRDGHFFAALENNASMLARFDLPAIKGLVRRCAELHIRHIATGGDPFETGSRRPLDFGHWSAHKIEQLSDFQISHGCAVAIGIALDVVYSRLQGFLDSRSAERILRLLEKLELPTFTTELLAKLPDGTPALLAGLEEFREHLGGQLTITLLRGIGAGFEVTEMNPASILQAIHELRQRQKLANVPAAADPFAQPRGPATPCVT